MSSSQDVPFLEFKGVCKSYYGNQVLKDISFSVHSGEIHGIIGENGAGKSTLMNILFGMPVIHSTSGYEGSVLIEGKVNTIKDPFDAMAHDLGMVHQEFMLIPEFSIFENIKLNKEPTKKHFFNKVLPKKLELLDIKKMREDARVVLKRVGLDIDELLTVAGLPVGHMQFVEIAREIDGHNLRLLVFDEPTAVLTEIEAKSFLQTMRHLAKDLNIALLFISHRLDEIKEVCDNVTILRDGELIGTFANHEIDTVKMAELMVGRHVSLKIDSVQDRKPPKDEDIILELKNFSVDMPGEELKNVNLKVRRGEILGFAGLAGQGKIGIANGIAGLFPTTGEILKDGRPLRLNSPKDSLQSGIAFLSEDRRGTGLLLDESIEENIAMTAMIVNKKFVHGGILSPLQLANRREIRRHAEEMIKILDMRCQDSKQMTKRLSGGNQQKVCISRVITLEPDLMLISEPTRGVDVGAKELILEKIGELSREGMTIILTSSELLELKAISDRIIVVAEGKFIACLRPDTEDKVFGLAMAGDIEDLRKIDPKDLMV